MVDVRGDVIRPPHGTTPALVCVEFVTLQVPMPMVAPCSSLAIFRYMQEFSVLPRLFLLSFCDSFYGICFGFHNIFKYDSSVSHFSVERVTIGHIYSLAMNVMSIWASSWQNQQSDCAPSEDSVQPGHPPILIRVFVVCSMSSQVPELSSCGQRRLWLDWVDAQTDLSLRWAHSHSVGFVMSRLIYILNIEWMDFLI